MSQFLYRFRSRIILALFAVLLLPGCFGDGKDDADPIDQVGVGEGPVSQLAEGRIVPLPSAEEIKQLGAENDIDVQWLFSDGFQACYGQPKRFFNSEFGKNIAHTHQINTFCASTCFFFQGIPIDFESAEHFVFALRLDPYEIQVTRRNERSTQIGLNQSGVLVLNYAEAFSPEEKLREMYPFLENLDQISKGTIEEYEFYVLLRDDFFPEMQKFLYFPPDGKTLVFFTGTDEAFRDVLMEKNPKGALIERLRRVNLAHTDMSLIATIEGSEGLSGYLENWLGSHPVIPEDMKKLLAPSMRALSLNINAAAPEESSVLSIVFDLDSGKNADEIAKAGRAMAIAFQTNPANAPADSANDLARFRNSVVHYMDFATEGSKVNISIVKFPEMATMLSNVIIDLHEMELTLRRLSILASAMNAHHEKYGYYPSNAITAEDGTPLLSWRVRLLEFMGDEERELLAQFNLSEPWNSPTNQPLLEQMPFIYLNPATSPATGNEPRTPLIAGDRTTVRLFSSPGTPFSKPELKVSDLQFPNNTIMLVSVTPENAVEWTRPDVLAFEEDKFHALFNGVMSFVLFNGYPDQVQFPDTPEVIHQLMHAITGTTHHDGE